MAKCSRRGFLSLGLPALVSRSVSRSQAGTAAQHAYPGEWESPVATPCPIPRSEKFRGLYFTGRHREYAHADTWYPSWASDDAQYSSFADGWVLDASGNKVAAACDLGFNATTGFAKIVGDDPLQLEVTALGNWKSPGMPYGGRYPCANILVNGVWYYGTYCCDIN